MTNANLQLEVIQSLNLYLPGYTVEYNIIEERKSP